MCLKQSFFHSNWVLRAILSLTVPTNCVSGCSNFDSLFLLDYTKSLMFLRLLDRKFNKNSKNVLKTVIFSLLVGFKGDFVPDCSYKLCFWLSKL